MSNIRGISLRNICFLNASIDMLRPVPPTYRSNFVLRRFRGYQYFLSIAQQCDFDGLAGESLYCRRSTFSLRLNLLREDSTGVATVFPISVPSLDDAVVISLVSNMPLGYTPSSSFIFFGRKEQGMYL